MGNKTEVNTLSNSAYLYDYDNRDHLQDDIPFYLTYGKAASKGVLELGCGTGRVSLILAENGYSVSCLDLSDSMLHVFRNKLKEKPVSVQKNITIIKGDMSAFSLAKKYGLIIAPFRAFQSLTDDVDIVNSLICIREHLVEDGIFIMNVFRPHDDIDKSWIYPETVQWEHMVEETGIYIVKKHWGDKIDTVNQIIYPHFAFEVTYPDGRFERVIDDLVLKYYRYEQMKPLLINSGFSIREEYGWYDKSSIASGRELIFVCNM